MSEKPKTLTPTKLKEKKGTQAKLSTASGVLGLAGLGAFGAAKIPGAKVMSRTPRLRRLANQVDTERANTAALGLSTGSAGVGGVGSLNFAQINRAEANKGKRVQKNDEAPSPFEDGYYGVSYDKTERD